MGRDLIIGNPPITVDLRRSARARRLSLRVSRLDGKVTLTMPPRAPEREAMAFLKEREDWLRGHLSDVTPAVPVQAGGEVLYLGQALRIAAGEGRRIRVTDDCLLLPAGAGPAGVKAFLKTRARRLSLRVSRLDGKVTLTMPPRAPEREAMAFLKEREDWLRGHLSDVTPAVSVQAGGEVLYRGQSVRIAAGEGRRIRMVEDCLLLPSGAGAASVKAFLKTRARDALVAASDRYAGLIGRSYSRLTLRDTRSRWGSCSSTGALMYSWRLIMAPPEVLDYVAAHEVAHLAQMNHSPAFWAVVEELMPDYAPRRSWLREHGDRLHRLRFDD